MRINYLYMCKKRAGYALFFIKILAIMDTNGTVNITPIERVCEIKSVNRHSMISDGAVSS